HTSSAFSSLSAPRLTYSGPFVLSSTMAVSSTDAAGRVARTPSTSTAPLRMSECARSRVSANPRWTRTTSSRLRDVFVEIFAQFMLQLGLAQLAQRGRLDLSHTLTGYA